MVPFTIRNLSKREKGYSAAITACWGHPILANPKEPLNVSFFPISFFLNSRKNQRNSPVWSGNLCGTSPASLSMGLLGHCRHPHRQPAQLEGQLLPYCGRIFNVGYSLSIALVHLIYARKPFGSIRFHVRSYGRRAAMCAWGEGERNRKEQGVVFGFHHVI